ncbi:MAG TPA: hypothetical protein VMF31_10520 [Solirubrobacterales bacterium]|nr:hypothetical protein [Solirubrobacterales bacterium]
MKSADITVDFAKALRRAHKRQQETLGPLFEAFEEATDPVARYDIAKDILETSNEAAVTFNQDVRRATDIADTRRKTTPGDLEAALRERVAGGPT